MRSLWNGVCHGNNLKAQPIGKTRIISTRGARLLPLEGDIQQLRVDETERKIGVGFYGALLKGLWDYNEMDTLLRNSSTSSRAFSNSATCSLNAFCKLRMRIPT